MTLVDTLSNAKTLVDNLADMLGEVETETLRATPDDAQAQVDTLADTLAQVEVATLGENWAMQRHWSTR